MPAADVKAVAPIPHTAQKPDRFSPLLHQRLSTVIIEALDWRECLERYDRPRTVMYLDPPYPGNGANYRHNMRAAADHQELADRLNAARCRWILSSYDTPEVYQLFSHCVITPVQSASGMKTGAAEARAGRRRTLNREVLITNFPPPATPQYLIAG